MVVLQALQTAQLLSLSVLNLGAMAFCLAQLSPCALLNASGGTCCLAVGVTVMVAQSC